MNRDWDAPEPESIDVDFEPDRSGKRARLLVRDRSASPQAETLKLSDVLDDDDNAWTKKSKIPRMKLYSDSVEPKSSAKSRILKSFKRKVANNPLSTEIYEEEEDDESMDEEESRDMDMRQKINLKVQARR